MPGRKEHRFMCKALLLYWTGDYPAISAVSGTHSKACHWCSKKSTAAPEVSRRVWDGYKRYLPEKHEMRKASAFTGAKENAPPPPARTHAEFVLGGKANEAHMQQIGMPDARTKKIFKYNSPYKTTGIKELSPLAHIPLFDLTWDILPDMMHILPGIWHRHIFSLLAGGRQPKAVKSRKKNTAVENADLQNRHRAVKAELFTWELSKETKENVDKRTRALAGTPTWIRSNIEVRSYSSAAISAGIINPYYVYLPSYLPSAVTFAGILSSHTFVCRQPVHMPPNLLTAAISAVCRHICRHFIKSYVCLPSAGTYAAKYADCRHICRHICLQSPFLLSVVISTFLSV